jgi:glycosyltransferase involved in cell wall biosynthesis
MKLLLVSDLAATGFGRVGQELGRRFLKAGIDLKIIGINHRDRNAFAVNLLSKGAKGEELASELDAYDAEPLWRVTISADRGGDAMGYALASPAITGQIWPGWKPDKALVVADPRAMLDRLMLDGGAFAKIPTLNYVPIEGGDLPPLWRVIWQHCEPVAMSRFGQSELTKLMGVEPPYISHGVSEGFFRISPTSPGRWKDRPVTSKDQAKAAFGWAGKTVILRTDRLVPRKNYPALFRIMRPILAAHPEVVLVIHCSPVDDGGRLGEFISREPGAVQKGTSWGHPQIELTRAHDTYRGLSDEELNVLYNAADIYLSPTMAEGFGLTLAEAAACGVPVVTTDFAAGPEVVGPGALLAPPAGYLTNIYAHEWALVDEDAMSAHVERLVSKPALRREIGEAGRKHVAQFSWDKAADEFMALMDYEPMSTATIAA